MTMVITLFKEYCFSFFNSCWYWYEIGIFFFLFIIIIFYSSGYMIDKDSIAYSYHLLLSICCYDYYYFLSIIFIE